MGTHRMQILEEKKSSPSQNVTIATFPPFLTEEESWTGRALVEILFHLL